MDQVLGLLTRDELDERCEIEQIEVRSRTDTIDTDDRRVPIVPFELAHEMTCDEPMCSGDEVLHGLKHSYHCNRAARQLCTHPMRVLFDHQAFSHQRFGG